MHTLPPVVQPKPHSSPQAGAPGPVDFLRLSCVPRIGLTRLPTAWETAAAALSPSHTGPGLTWDSQALAAAPPACLDPSPACIRGALTAQTCLGGGAAGGSAEDWVQHPRFLPVRSWTRNLTPGPHLQNGAMLASPRDGCEGPEEVPAAVTCTAHGREASVLLLAGCRVLMPYSQPYAQATVC